MHSHRAPKDKLNLKLSYSDFRNVIVIRTILKYTRYSLGKKYIADSCFKRGDGKFLLFISLGWPCVAIAEIEREKKRFMKSKLDWQLRQLFKSNNMMHLQQLRCVHSEC